jgi:hypothetical protein
MSLPLAERGRIAAAQDGGFLNLPRVCAGYQPDLGPLEMRDRAHNLQHRNAGRPLFRAFRPRKFPSNERLTSRDDQG